MMIIRPIGQEQERLTSVKFSAEVNDWDAAGDTESKVVWLPSNVVDPATVTSVSVAAGNSATAYTNNAATTSFTITVTGCKNGETVTANFTDVATAATPTATDAEGKAVVTVTLPENTSTDVTKSSMITITGTKSDDSDFTTTVTITQAKATA